MTRRILRSLILLLPSLAMLCAMERTWPAAAQVPKSGQIDPTYCTFKTIYESVRAGTMPLVRGCDAARVAGVFREARMPLEVAPPDGAPRFVVTPSGGQSVPSLRVIGQSPAEGQPLPRPSLEVEGVYVQPQKFKLPLISLATGATPPPPPTSILTPKDLQPPSSPIALSVKSDMSAARGGDTIAFTVAAQRDLARPVSLTYVISDPASCAPPVRRRMPLLLRPRPGFRTIHYHVCLDDGDKNARLVTFTAIPATDEVTIDPSGVSVAVAGSPTWVGEGTEIWHDLGTTLAVLPSWLWWTIGGGAAVLAVWRLRRRDPAVISATTLATEPVQESAEPPPISATCALHIGTPASDWATPPFLPSVTVRVNVGVGRPTLIGPAEEMSDG